MGTKNNPGEYDCHAAAAPDEPIFTLKATDSVAPDTVRDWARRYINKHLVAGTVTDRVRAKHREALDCAPAMEAWRIANQGDREEAERIAALLMGSSGSLDDYIDNPSLAFCAELDAIVLQCETCDTWGDADSDVKFNGEELICNDCED